MSTISSDMDQFDVRSFLRQIMEAETEKADELGYEADSLRTEANFLEDRADEHRDRAKKLEAALASIDPTVEQEIKHRIERITIPPDTEMKRLIDQAKGLPFGSELARINEQYRDLASMKLVDVVTSELPEMLLS